MQYEHPSSSDCGKVFLRYATAAEISLTRRADTVILVKMPPAAPNEANAAWKSTRNEFKVGAESGSHAKRNQVQPSGPTARELTRSSSKLEEDWTPSFSRAFGVLGVPMLLVLLVCIAWTSWLVLLALEPNKAANWLMNTDAYDKGEFWLIDDANPHMTLAGAVGLVAVDFCYVVVLLRMVFWREKLVATAFQEPDEASKASSSRATCWMSAITPHYRQLCTLWRELSSFTGRNRKKWVRGGCFGAGFRFHYPISHQFVLQNAFVKLFDFATQMAMLRQLLLSGSPVSLSYGFAVFLAVNALSCVANILTDRFSALTEVLIDSMYGLSSFGQWLHPGSPLCSVALTCPQRSCSRSSRLCTATTTSTSTEKRT
jgi:hypothetical protein